MKHELVQLAGRIDWAWIDGEIAPLYSDNGRPGIESRFVIGLLLLKHIYGLSDEAVCQRWVYDPYFQFFTGEEFFQHTFPHERSDLSHWRKRLGDKLELLLAESLRVAHDSGALRTRDLERVTVDTTVQPKDVTRHLTLTLCGGNKHFGSNLGGLLELAEDLDHRLVIFECLLGLLVRVLKVNHSVI